MHNDHKIIFNTLLCIFLYWYRLCRRDSKEYFFKEFSIVQRSIKRCWYSILIETYIFKSNKLTITCLSSSFLCVNYWMMYLIKIIFVLNHFLAVSWLFQQNLPKSSDKLRHSAWRVTLGCPLSIRSQSRQRWCPRAGQMWPCDVLSLQRGDNISEANSMVYWGYDSLLLGICETCNITDFIYLIRGAWYVQPLYTLNIGRSE